MTARGKARRKRGRNTPSAATRKRHHRRCERHRALPRTPQTCRAATTYAYFMDDWTIFYWGWWISWAPFVGMFIARISRGRTVGQLIKGAFIAPVLFGFFYLTVLGSLGIKMQRVAELALGHSTYC